MNGAGNVGSGAQADLAVAMAEAALAVKEPETVEEALTRLVGMAQSIIPGAEHCGISVATRRSVTTVASTDAMVDRLDQLQYTFDEVRAWTRYAITRRWS